MNIIDDYLDVTIWLGFLVEPCPPEKKIGKFLRQFIASSLANHDVVTKNYQVKYLLGNSKYFQYFKYYQIWSTLKTKM